MPLVYQPLSEYLAGQRRNELSLSFAEVEAILGCPLPYSAYAGNWWTNTRTRPQARVAGGRLVRPETAGAPAAGDLCPAGRAMPDPLSPEEREAAQILQASLGLACEA
jgi:hypothetical protein